ncbi:hypothetical protein P9112_001052 [Eukaryota sp. TZLM1-RC]
MKSLKNIFTHLRKHRYNASHCQELLTLLQSVTSIESDQQLFTSHLCFYLQRTLTTDSASVSAVASVVQTVVRGLCLNSPNSKLFTQSMITSLDTTLCLLIESSCPSFFMELFTPKGKDDFFDLSLPLAVYSAIMAESCHELADSSSGEKSSSITWVNLLTRFEDFTFITLDNILFCFENHFKSNLIITKSFKIVDLFILIVGVYLENSSKFNLNFEKRFSSLFPLVFDYALKHSLAVVNDLIDCVLFPVINCHQSCIICLFDLFRRLPSTAFSEKVYHKLFHSLSHLLVRDYELFQGFSDWLRGSCCVNDSQSIKIDGLDQMIVFSCHLSRLCTFLFQFSDIDSLILAEFFELFLICIGSVRNLSLNNHSINVVNLHLVSNTKDLFKKVSNSFPQVFYSSMLKSLSHRDSSLIVTVIDHFVILSEFLDLHQLIDLKLISGLLKHCLSNSNNVSALNLALFFCGINGMILRSYQSNQNDSEDNQFCDWVSDFLCVLVCFLVKFESLIQSNSGLDLPSFLPLLTSLSWLINTLLIFVGPQNNYLLELESCVLLDVVVSVSKFFCQRSNSELVSTKETLLSPFKGNSQFNCELNLAHSFPETSQSFSDPDESSVSSIDCRSRSCSIGSVVSGASSLFEVDHITTNYNISKSDFFWNSEHKKEKEEKEKVEKGKEGSEGTLDFDSPLFDLLSLDRSLYGYLDKVSAFPSSLLVLIPKCLFDLNPSNGSVKRFVDFCLELLFDNCCEKDDSFLLLISFVCKLSPQIVLEFAHHRNCFEIGKFLSESFYKLSIINFLLINHSDSQVSDPEYSITLPRTSPAFLSTSLARFDLEMTEQSTTIGMVFKSVFDSFGVSIVILNGLALSNLFSHLLNSEFLQSPSLHLSDICKFLNFPPDNTLSSLVVFFSQYNIGNNFLYIENLIKSCFLFSFDQNLSPSRLLSDHDVMDHVYYDLSFFSRLVTLLSSQSHVLLPDSFFEFFLSIFNNTIVLFKEKKLSTDVMASLSICLIEILGFFDLNIIAEHLKSSLSILFDLFPKLITSRAFAKALIVFCLKLFPENLQQTSFKSDLNLINIVSFITQFFQVLSDVNFGPNFDLFVENLTLHWLNFLIDLPSIDLAMTSAIPVLLFLCKVSLRQRLSSLFYSSLAKIVTTWGLSIWQSVDLLMDDFTKPNTEVSSIYLLLINSVNFGTFRSPEVFEFWTLCLNLISRKNHLLFVNCLVNVFSNNVNAVQNSNLFSIVVATLAQNFELVNQNFMNLTLGSWAINLIGLIDYCQIPESFTVRLLNFVISTFTDPTENQSTPTFLVVDFYQNLIDLLIKYFSSTETAVEVFLLKISDTFIKYLKMGFIKEFSIFSTLFSINSPSPMFIDQFLSKFLTTNYSEFNQNTLDLIAFDLIYCFSNISRFQTLFNQSNVNLFPFSTHCLMGTDQYYLVNLLEYCLPIDTNVISSQSNFNQSNPNLINLLINVSALVGRAPLDSFDQNFLNKILNCFIQLLSLSINLIDSVQSNTEFQNFIKLVDFIPSNQSMLKLVDLFNDGNDSLSKFKNLLISNSNEFGIISEII